MRVATTPFDASQYLISPESQIELLADAFDTSCVAYIANALESVAMARGMQTAKPGSEKKLHRHDALQALVRAAELQRMPE